MRTWRASVWFGIAILLAALLAGCSAPLAQAPKSPGGDPTVTPATSLPPLAWRSATTPPNFDVRRSGIAVSPVDGHIAWVCESSGSTSADIWQTQDAGLHWTVAGHISITTNGVGNCELTPDEVDPHALVATITWGSGEAGDLTGESFYSSDDAAHWQSLPQGSGLSEVATLNDVAVGIVPEGLALSKDGFSTYSTTRPDSLKSQDIFRIWVAPSGGTILAASLNNGLWKTTDLGSTWTRVSTPFTQTTMGRWLNGSGKFLICGGVSNPPSLQCSADLGGTWSTVPSLTYTHACSKCGVGIVTQTDQCATAGIAPDGSILAYCPVSKIADITSLFVLYRFTPGDTAWTILGGAHGVPGDIPDNGPLWTIPTESTTTQAYTLQFSF
ncbi:MAG TPA: hypothetical protein VF792_05750 [Ktedonobacterales bacterium]